jgi:hypothetical protein
MTKKYCKSINELPGTQKYTKINRTFHLVKKLKKPKKKPKCYNRINTIVDRVTSKEKHTKRERQENTHIKSEKQIEEPQTIQRLDDRVREKHLKR